MDPISIDDIARSRRAAYPATAPRKFQDRVWLHVLLFVLTVATTTVIGALHYGAFIAGFEASTVSLPLSALLVHGLWYSVAILAILGCHEMGHYLACRYYDVDASLPFFLPIPFLLTGTLGAFIRIREPLPSKRILFDIGIAGPIAGFLVAVLTLFIGLSMSNVVRLPATWRGDLLGEPLLFQFASHVIWGEPPVGYALNLHPMAFAAWFGLLATALNLFPVGQLDGGHISYAVLGPRYSTYVTFVMIAVGAGLISLSVTWIAWTVLMIVMLFLVGPRHPRVYDEDVPLDRTRLALAVFALVMFVLCFTPAPVSHWI